VGHFSRAPKGARVIPLNELVWSAFAALKKRADSLWTYAPENFIFHREAPVIDGTRSLSSWRSAWRTLRKDAAKEDKDGGREAMPRLANLRFYDLRHQAITEMLEAGIPEGVIREVAGHFDAAMTRHYSHPRLAARRAAMEALMTTKTQEFPGGYVTTHVTKALPEGIESR
jgi:integrase